MVIKRIKGDTYPISVQILDSNNDPFPLTGCIAFFTVKRNIQDTDAQALISITTTSHIDPVNGLTSFAMTSPVNTNIEGDFYYDVKIKDGTSIIRSVFKDKILFVSNVTIRIS